jgi:purine-nucleoside/S-methyl-5'-thioadenosine phosphorylase / adenosine deaminase
LSLSWDEVEGVPLLRWSAVPGVTAVFSGRRGGVSEGAYEGLNLGLRSGDDRGRVVENRRRLCAAAAVAPERTSSCHQIHSAVVQDAAADPAQPFDDPAVSSPDGDGLVTRVPGRGVVAFGSDCIPIVVARTDGTGVGVCHAGWRGLLGGVVEQTVERLGEGALVAAVGPCAGRDRYEVGPDVAAPLAGRFGPAALNGRNADLAACAAIALERSGVGAVDVSGLCTIGDEERFFSYRRDRRACGRQAVIAHLEVA